MLDGVTLGDGNSLPPISAAAPPIATLQSWITIAGEIARTMSVRTAN